MLKYAKKEEVVFMHFPSWIKDAVFYNIYPQSFYDTNGDGIGDLNGITEKLDYIKDMGFTALWLNPFYESPFNDAGYDVTDFYKVAPRYGTNEDFKRLCDEAHKRGLKVCVDLVAGHTAMECEWFQESAKAEKNRYSNRYVWTNSWRKEYPDCIGGYGDRNGMYLKNFFYCQPALNYGFYQVDDSTWQLPMDHPDCIDTKNELLNVMRYWIDLGADGYRVDMASSLVKNDPDGIGIKMLWNEIRGIFDKEFPECALIAEWSYPSRAIAAGFHIDFLLHFNISVYTMLFRADRNRNLCAFFEGHTFFDKDGNGHIDPFVDEYLRESEAVRGKGYISMPTGNHDFPRISYQRTKKEIEVVYAFLFTQPGVPFVYYGDEIGMEYVADIPSKEGGFERTGSRTPMQWKRGKNAGFSTCEDAAKLYLPVDENGVNVEEQLQDEHSLLNLTKRLIALRKSSKALSADGEFELLNRKNGGYPFVYKRFTEDEEYVIAINPTDREDYFPFEQEYVAIVDTNDDNVVADGKIQLKPAGYVIIRTK